MASTCCDFCDLFYSIYSILYFNLFYFFGLGSHRRVSVGGSVTEGYGLIITGGDLRKSFHRAKK